jgi:hypothetical protein
MRAFAQETDSELGILRKLGGLNVFNIADSARNDGREQTVENGGGGGISDLPIREGQL